LTRSGAFIIVVGIDMIKLGIRGSLDAINNFELPEANGFFWGSDSYFWHDENDEPYPENEYWYKKNDLMFVEEARKMLDKKWRVYYSCWY